MRLGGTASMKASDLDERLDFLATKIGISSSDWTSSASLRSMPRVVSPPMPRLALFIPGKRPGRLVPQPCVIESPRKTTAF
jgi:hypothetical protein